MDSNNELKRVREIADWYVSGQLDFDKTLVRLRYRSIKKYFVGEKVLELGSAEGIMTRMLLDDFNHIAVVEAASKLLDLVPDNSKISKYNCLIEDFESDQLYDTIILDHVLEHVDHPVNILKAAARNLSIGGRFIIGVPNALSIHRLVAVEMGLLESPYELNERDITVGHRRVYDMERLLADVDAAGLVTIDVGGSLLKPLSNGQIQDCFSPEMIEGFYKVGEMFVNHAADIFAVVTKG